MTRVITWNIGCAFPLIYLKPLGITYKGQKITNQYFQPILNGELVSKKIESTNPDIIFLQEIWDPKDLEHISILKNYPHQKLLNSWYHKHSVLVASKNEFSVTKIGHFNIVSSMGINYMPIHFNSFSALKRLKDDEFLETHLNRFENIIILGDTNIWSRGSWFLFKNDKLAYNHLTNKFKDFSRKLMSTTIVGFGLDKVFGSQNLNIQNIKSPRIRGDFMDHYPIIFDIL